jgi:hypothetical protein
MGHRHLPLDGLKGKVHVDVVAEPNRIVTVMLSSTSVDVPVPTALRYLSRPSTSSESMGNLQSKDSNANASPARK